MKDAELDYMIHHMIRLVPGVFTRKVGTRGLQVHAHPKSFQGSRGKRKDKRVREDRCANFKVSGRHAVYIHVDSHSKSSPIE